jgi:hypothetical protein
VPTRTGDTFTSTSASSSSIVPPIVPTADAEPSTSLPIAPIAWSRDRGMSSATSCARTIPPRRIVPDPKREPRPFFKVSERMSTSSPRSAASRSSQLYENSESRLS